MKPKISVVMAAYNEEEQLEPTIESILNQSLKDFEFVIVNDGSTDGTPEILEKYTRKDKRVTIIENEKNLGLTRSLNRGIKSSTGEYIARIDAGDVSAPERLERQADFLDRHKSVHIVGCYHHWIDEKGEVINSYEFPTSPEKIKSHIFGFGAIAAHPCLMIRRELFDRTGLYDETLSTSMEYELYMRTIANRLEISNVPEFRVSVLRREKGISISRNKRIFRNMFHIRSRYLWRMFSIKNFFYTLISFILTLIPAFLLKEIICSELWGKKLRGIFIKG